MFEHIKTGDKFLCIKDVYMVIDYNVVDDEPAYIHGEVYVSEYDGNITDEQGRKLHGWPLDGEINEFFVPYDEKKEKAYATIDEEPMVKNNTTHEQAEKLIKLGIDVNTADMHFHRVPNPNYDWDNVEYLWNEYPKFDIDKHFNDAKRPCWSLATLFDMLPNWVVIPVVDEDGEEYATESSLSVNKTRIAYKHYNPYEDMYECDMQCYGDTFFDCVYNAVCWLLENKIKGYASYRQTSGKNVQTD